MPSEWFNISRLPFAFVVSSGIQESMTFTRAQNDPHWEETMREDYHALIANHTWESVPHPSDRHVIGCKWVYKVKEKPLARWTISRHVWYDH